MPSQLPRFTFRTDSSLLEKLRYIAKKNSRSANKEIEFLIKKHIENYETQNGKIEINDN